MSKNCLFISERVSAIIEPKTRDVIDCDYVKLSDVITVNDKDVHKETVMLCDLSNNKDEDKNRNNIAKEPLSDIKEESSNRAQLDENT